MSGQGAGVLARLRQPVELRHPSRQLVGGLPQVSLLPAEVREAGAVAAHRRKMIAIVVATAIVAGGAVALAQRVDDDAQQRLAVAGRQSQMITKQLAQFDDVRTLQKQIAVGKAGVAVGSSTLIDWQQQIDLIEASMPSGYSVTSFTADGATPLAVYEQGDSLLTPRRAAVIKMAITASSAGDEFSAWLRELKNIPAYEDESADVTLNSGTGTYTIDLTIHLGAKAISAKAWTER